MEDEDQGITAGREEEERREDEQREQGGKCGMREREKEVMRRGCEGGGNERNMAAQSTNT